MNIKGRCYVRHEAEPAPPPKTRQELMKLLEADPSLYAFYGEIQDVLQIDPDFPLTIKFMARRLIPDSLDERIEDTEARISVNVTKLVALGLLQARRYKTEYLGDYLPTYVAIGL